MSKPKFLKRIFEIDPSKIGTSPVIPEGAVFYDMDNDCFYRWIGKGRLMKYIRAYSFLEDEDERNNKKS